MALFLVQLLNGFQLGILLFLLAAGLTLVFGIMNFVNLTHGSLYMMGAYFAASTYARSGSYIVALVVAFLGTFLLGLIMERLVLSKLYRRDHLDQVLCTFGLLLFFDEVVSAIWGLTPLYINVPHWLSGTVGFGGFQYSSYRFAVIVVGLLAGAVLYLLVHHTRIGMLVRAGASNSAMVSVLGVNTRLLNALVFAVGAALAGLAGFMAAPLLAVQPGMGGSVLILTLVVIVTGGIGSVQGAFYGSLIVGVLDTLGRTYIPMGLREVLERGVAQATGPALSSMLIYLIMAAVLSVRPQGLFPVRYG